MIEVKGTYNTAKLFTDTADDATIAQVRNLMNQPSAKGSKVRIMPDCHAGAGCVIGTTMTITDKVIPNLVGVDIGCGMLATKLKEQRINLPKFDSISQAEVPASMKMRRTAHSLADEISISDLACYKKTNCRLSEDVFRLSLGTLGGGNHFWELDRDEEGRREILAVRNDRGGMDYVLVDACGDIKALQSIQDRMQRQIGGISESQDKVRERMRWFQRFRRVRK